MTNTEMLDQALWLASWGCHVFPLYPRHKEPHGSYPPKPLDPKSDEGQAWLAVRREHSRCRRPLAANWPKVATNEPDQIRRLWSAEPEAGIAVACEPSGLVVVDFDRWDGKSGLRTFDGLGRMFDLSDAYRADTGSGGIHLYFRQRKGKEIRNAADFGPEGFSGLDTRGKGGYAVAPPSYWTADPDKRRKPGNESMPETGQYVWEDEEFIDGPPPVIPEDFADWILLHINGGRERGGVDLQAVIKDGPEAGEGRHVTMLRVFGKFLDGKTDPELAWEMGLAVMARWSEPLDEVDARGLFERVLRRDMQSNPQRYDERAQEVRRRRQKADRLREESEVARAKAEKARRRAEEDEDEDPTEAAEALRKADRLEREASKKSEQAEREAAATSKMAKEVEKAEESAQREAKRTQLENDLVVASKDEVFDMVSTAIQLRVVDLIQVRPHDSEWMLALGGPLDGQNIRVGTTYDLQSFGKIQSLVAESAHILLDHELKKEWPEYVRAMLKHATMVAQDLTRARITIDHLSGYLEDTPPVQDLADLDEDWRSAFQKKKPIIRKGKLCIHSTPLRAWAGSMRLPPEDLSDSALGNVGFEASPITVRIGNRRMCRSFWQIEMTRWSAQLDSEILDPQVT